MPREVNRYDVLTQLRAIERQLLSLQKVVSTLIADLHVGIHHVREREQRPYDREPIDPDIVAERYGVRAPDDLNNMPDWWIAKYGHHLHTDE